jgi:hypothetical protein
MAVHARPAAFEGSDGLSYSVDIMTDETGERDRPWGAYLLFVRWRRIGEQGVSGHLESEFLAHAASEAEARAALAAMPLVDVKRALDALIAAQSGGRSARRWWDAMRDE